MSNPNSAAERVLLEACQKSIEKGSKSFSMAAKVFSRSQREGAMSLYAWCRHCDDAIDQALGSAEEKLAVLNELIDQTKKSYGGEPLNHPAFEAFRFLVKRYQVPIHYPLELLEGMRMDIEGRKYETVDDLILYSYRVAGTVGLMMCHVMGISETRALKHACDLGIAMQLTNICRDIGEDAAMGRVYLPAEWLPTNVRAPMDVASPFNRWVVCAAVQKTLRLAEHYYASGDQGLVYLGLRPACAIAAAREIYSAIGEKVELAGGRAWDERIWIRPSEKIKLLLRGVSRVLMTSLDRYYSPWRATPIQQIWRMQ